jgi:ketosteroid isomerase-like protein
MTGLAEGDHRTRSDDLRIVEDLNRNYLRAAEFADVAWYEAHLADDFVISVVDGSLLDRTAFIERIARPHPFRDYCAVDVRIRLVGELALVHAGFHYTKPDGQAGTGRYTDVYAQRRGRWLCVSAHFNRF